MTNALESYFSQCRVRRVTKGTLLILQEQVPQHAYGIKRGAVKVYNVTSNGEEKSISFMGKGELLPTCWLLGVTELSLFYYQAYSDCELYIIEKPEFEAYLHKHMALAYELLKSQTMLFVGSSLRINALVQTKARARLLHTLRYLCLRHGRDIAKDAVRIALPLTQQELANLVGMTRETMALELQKLRQQKIIQSQHRFYVVNTKRLDALLDDEYNPGLSI